MNFYLTVIFLYCYIILLLVNPTSPQYIYHSLTVISQPGNQFLPIRTSAQLISSLFLDSQKLCSIACNTNILCRIFDYEAIQPNQCRLFEGDTETLGSIIPSSMPNSVVGTIQITPSLFTEYGQSCPSVCSQSRYLICGNSLKCECIPHTYWDASIGMCVPQSPIFGATCEQDLNACREDLGYTCLQFNQCGPLSLLSGTTIADSNTVIQGSSIIGFNAPIGSALYGDQDESLIVIDNNKRVINLQNIDTDNKNISILFYTWSNGTTFSGPAQVFIDLQHGNDVYISDNMICHVILFYSMQYIDPLPKAIAGITGSCGATLDKLNGPRGIVLDSQQNLYVVDQGNHRIMLWKRNATSGILIAGQGTPGNDAMSFNIPIGIFLDENNSLLYVADGNNHRIQLFKLDGTPPYNGTTVAGGNGAGLGSHQLNFPRSVFVSKKTGAIYIADSANHRIQKWDKGATKGVTIAGSPNGIAGTDATKLKAPYRVVINSDETRMYVSDTGNNRIQRFDLI